MGEARPVSERLRLDLPLLLPDVRDKSDACVGRLVSELDGRDGVESVHIAEEEGAPPRLCIHYDPERLPLARIRELAEAQGAKISRRFGHLSVDTAGIWHQRRAATVAESLRRLPGVIEASASVAGPVSIEYDRDRITAQALIDHLTRMGAGPRGTESVADRPEERADHHDHNHGHGHGHSHDHGGWLGGRAELIFACLAGVALAIGFLVERLTGLPRSVSTAFYILSYCLSGFFTVREAIDNLRLRRFEIDTLMLVAAAGAAALGQWAEGALLLFLFSLGHALEHGAMGKARSAIDGLRKLAPETTRRYVDGGTEEVRVEELRIGDILFVKPGERIAADGFLLAGSGSVDEAAITGESVPADKIPVPDPVAAAAAPGQVAAVHRLYAGTLNGSGALEMEVTRTADDSTLARIVHLVSQAEAQKSETQRFAERFERIFVPLVLVLIALLLCAPLALDEPFAVSFYRAMAVLVAASPCALAISTPSAVLSGVARAARGGVLVKGGGPLEALGRIRAMAFDKTGTLTSGHPVVTDVIAAEGIEPGAPLTAAAAVDRLSAHPLALAVVREADARGDAGDMQVTDASDHSGRGMSATFEGRTLLIGNRALLADFGQTLDPAVAEAEEKLRAEGRTTVLVQDGARTLGVIGLRDTARPSSAAAIARLRAMGLSPLILLSGDSQPVAEAVAAEVGIDEARGGLLPQDKADAVRALRDRMPVAMVGDGVNDAPAMANATVGIAMGAAGSDVALETADVALMADDLSALPFAIALGRETRKVIRQNLFVSLGVVAILIPATILGLRIGPAVIAHEGSTLIVIANALRLLRFR